MIYDLVTSMQEFIVPRNREELSVYDQMIRKNEMKVQKLEQEKLENTERLEKQKRDEDRAQRELSAAETMSSEQESMLRKQWLAERLKQDVCIIAIAFTVCVIFAIDHNAIHVLPDVLWP